MSTGEHHRVRGVVIAFSASAPEGDDGSFRQAL